MVPCDSERGDDGGSRKTASGHVGALPAGER